MRVVVVPDKFKGTLSAADAARAMAAGVRAAMPSAEVVIVPAADGGEGFLEALLAGGGTTRDFLVRGPLGERLTAQVARLSDGIVALESAHACGLGLLDEPAPLDASTRGVGDLIDAVRGSEREARTVVVGVGGTASTDGGTGAASALGWRFLDEAGHDLPPGGGELARLHAIEPPEDDARSEAPEVVGACDVDNRLLGPDGSARAFGPQKGASAAEIGRLESGLERLAAVLREDLGVNVEDLDYGGAGGGLAAGLSAFCGAKLESGFDLVARRTGLAGELARADAVLTGEGTLDATTSSGKVVSGVMRRTPQKGVRRIVVAGRVDKAARTQELEGAVVVSLLERFGERALSHTAACIENAVREALATGPPV